MNNTGSHSPDSSHRTSPFSIPSPHRGSHASTSSDAPALDLSWDSLEWREDILGDSFSCADIPLGPDPDGEGEIVATLVRYHPSRTLDAASLPAILWVHGMTDYFFQSHVAERFAEQGYSFYALDLRKCGRSHRSQQKWHYVSDLSYYYPELTTTLRLLLEKHTGVIPLAHSTGGLIVARWLDSIRHSSPELFKEIPAVIMNSPWLDMQFSRPLVWTTQALTPLILKFNPSATLPLGEGKGYGTSLHSSYQGEWNYDLQWKPTVGHAKYFRWLQTIFQAQKELREQPKLPMPVLTLHSSRSELGKPYSARSQSADTVLNVEQISLRASQLSSNSTVVAIDSALHDVFLSAPEVREVALRRSFSWLVYALSFPSKGN